MGTDESSLLSQFERISTDQIRRPGNLRRQLAIKIGSIRRQYMRILPVIGHAGRTRTAIGTYRQLGAIAAMRLP